jgi:hypothetical protein
LLDVLQLEDSEQKDLSPTKSAQEQVFLTLSVVAVTGVAFPRTMCFWGLLGNQHIWILLDSGSSHTFISPAVASQYGSVESLYFPLKVQVANGQLLVCNSHILATNWSI